MLLLYKCLLTDFERGYIILEKIITDYLYHINSIEAKQLESNSFHFDFPKSSVSYTDNRMVLLDTYFLNNRDIFINKHNRFATYPEHKHDFLEINYMYDGQCTQIINGKEVTLEKGNLLFLDQGSVHSINKIGKEDILINIVFHNKKIDLEWLADLNQQNSLVFNFLTQNIKNSTKHSYLLFDSHNNNHIQEVLYRILKIYFLEEKSVDNMINLYIPILITELITNVTYVTFREDSFNSDSLIIQVLDEIEKNHSSVSLDSIAKKMGYNKNYLSNRIKNLTGKTFTKLLNGEKIKHSAFFLKNTDLNIEQIMFEVGYQNKTYFYKLFKEKFGCTPMQYRTR